MGSLTSVTYYHIVPELSANNSIASDSSGPSDIGVETKKYQKIKNFLVKLESGVSNSQEGEEDDKKILVPYPFNLFIIGLFRNKSAGHGRSSL